MARLTKAMKAAQLLAESTTSISEVKEKEDTWRLLNRKPFDDACAMYQVLEKRNKKFELDTRMEQAAHAFDLSHLILEQVREGKNSQKNYEEEYAKAWKERAELTKGKLKSDSWMARMDRELIEAVGWTLSEFMEANQKTRR